MRYANLRDGLVLAICPSVSGGGGIVPDLSGRGNHGSLVNLPASAYVSWFRGAAIRCNVASIRDFVDCGNICFIPNDITFSSWVCKTVATGVAFSNPWIGGRWNTGASPGTNEYALLMQNFASGLGETPSFAIEIGSTISSVVSSASLVIGRFSHVCGVRRGSQLEVWLDGVLQGTTTGVSTAAITNRSRNFRIGDTDISSDQVTNADYDDTRTYSRALTEHEIRLLASEPGIGLRPERASVFFSAQLFNAAWGRNSNVIISPVGAA